MVMSSLSASTSSARSLRKRTRCPDYKEKKESDILSDIPASHHKILRRRKDNLYAIEIIEEDQEAARYKVHYVGYSCAYDEWKEKDAIVDIGDQNPDPEDPNPGPNACPMYYDHGLIKRFSLYYELATRIKIALNSSRKGSPMVRIDLPFDKIEFNGGLRTYGVKKCCVRGIEYYTITKFQDLNPLLGVNWHWRGIDVNGDFCYVILKTIEFYLYPRRPIKEFIPSADGKPPEEVQRPTGEMLVFRFVQGDGVSAQFGVDKTIFVN